MKNNILTELFRGQIFVELDVTDVYPTPAGVECELGISFSTNMQTRWVW